jgi:hypothetical protein
MQELCAICDHPLLVPHNGYRINGVPFCSSTCALGDRSRKKPCGCFSCRIARAKKEGAMEDPDLVEVVSVAILAVLIERVDDSTAMANNLLKALRKQGCDVIKLNNLRPDPAFKLELLQKLKDRGA